MNKFDLERQLFGYRDEDGAGGGSGSTKTTEELEAERIETERLEVEKNKGKTPEEIETEKKAAEEAEKNKGKTFTQKELDEIVSNRLKRERDAADRKQRESQGEFEKLYAEVKPKYETLESEVSSLREIVNSNIDTIIKDWDADLRSTDPGNDDLKARQAWVEKSSKLAAKLAGTKQPVDGEPGNHKNQNGKLKISGSSYMQGAYSKPTIPGQK